MHCIGITTVDSCIYRFSVFATKWRMEFLSEQDIKVILKLFISGF